MYTNDSLKSKNLKNCAKSQQTLNGKSKKGYSVRSIEKPICLMKLTYSGIEKGLEKVKNIVEPKTVREIKERLTADICKGTSEYGWLGVIMVVTGRAS